MIKAKLKNKTTNLYEFPILMTFKDEACEVVVLFSTETLGTVVFSNTKTWVIGEVHDSWELSELQVYEGQLILENVEG